MAWARIDDKFFDNQKIRDAGKEAALLYLSGLVYVSNQLSDGFISDSALDLVAFKAWVKGSKQCAEILVSVGLWERVNGGYYIHNFLEYNPSKEQIQQSTAAKVSAGRKGGQASAQARAQAPAQASASGLLEADGQAPAQASASGLLEADGQAPAQAKFKQGPSINPSPLNPLKKITPPTPPNGEDGDFSEFDPVKVFSKVTGMAAIPAGDMPAVMTALDALWQQKGETVDSLANYLTPFYEAWTSRRGKNGAFYSKTNCTWLTDWAVAGEIPPAPDPEKQKTRTLTDPYGNTIEVAI